MSWPTVSATEICNRFPVGTRAATPGPRSPREFFDVLCRDEPDAAVEFLAHALPARLAAWWGCLCLWDVSGPTPTPPADAALRAVLQWVLEPGEERRRAAAHAASEAEDLPAGILAQGVFFSEGSMIARNLPVVPPPPVLANRMIAGAILFAAGQGRVPRIEQLRLFLHWGADVADGKNHWSHA